MQNNELQNHYSEDEIDLNKLFKPLFHSWKLIILITLASFLLTFIYTAQKEPKYESGILLEIGSYETSEGIRLIEPVSSLIQELKIDLIYKQQLGNSQLNFYPIEKKLLKISYISYSAEFNKNLLNETLVFVKDRHESILAKNVNSISNEISFLSNEISFLKNSFEAQKANNTLSINNALKSIDDEINFYNNSLLIDEEAEKFNITNTIKGIDNKIPGLKNKINFLLKLIPEEENNLTLLQSDNDALVLRTSSSPTLQQIIYSYNLDVIDLKNEINNLILKKSNLEYQLNNKLIEDTIVSNKLFELNKEKSDLNEQLNNKFIEDTVMSNKLFELNKAKSYLESEMKLIKDQKNLTQIIHGIKTNEIKNNSIIMMGGVILGFIISVFLVFIRQIFYKEKS